MSNYDIMVYAVRQIVVIATVLHGFLGFGFGLVFWLRVLKG